LAILSSVLSRAPENADIWVDELVKGEFNGCGHVRLMLEGQTDADGNPAYGPRAKELAEGLIRAFFR
jgi:hypothetical protein